MINNDNFDFTFVQSERLLTAVITSMAGIIGAAVLIAIGFSKLPESALFKKVSLQHRLESGSGYTSTFYHNDLIGQTGSAFTVLRPGGKVELGGQIYDAATTGSFVEKGSKVKVISIESTTLIVRQLEESLSV